MSLSAPVLAFEENSGLDTAESAASCALKLVRHDALSKADLSAIEQLAHQPAARHSGNVFFAPRAVAASASLSRGSIDWLLWFQDGRLCLAAPVVISRIASFSLVRIWTHTYAPLGTPLADKRLRPDLLFEELADRGFSALACPLLETGSTLATAVALPGGRQDGRAGFWSGIAERAVLTSDWTEAAALSAQRKKKLRKMQRTLPLVHRVLRGDAARDEGFRQFCELEAMGWKGAAGSALKQSDTALAYASELVASHGAQDTLAIDSLEDPQRQGNQSVAMVISFEIAGRGVVWKIGHNTDYDAVSPGYQVILAASRRFAAENTPIWIDSLAGPEHPLVGWLWPQRLTVGTLVVPLKGSHAPARTLSGFYQAEARLRQVARALRQRLRR
uniref:GNAT family N-acetyltransferase n=1 Tax=Pararhizobium sp. IMCC3301 TaxID=3067904 RepID=UPI00274119D8|nr:GNAT family N-acetyltransferase [Pararhizobium sp. IMCC3301]